MPVERQQFFHDARRVIAGAAVGMLIGVPGGIYLATRNSPQPEGTQTSEQSYKPGGQWVEPLQHVERRSVSSPVHFLMEAYPTSPDTTPIEEVYITYGYQDQKGPWPIACRAQPIRNDKYPNEWGCDWQPTKEGDARVSFTVIDTKGRRNDAPQGIHELIIAKPS